MVQDVVAVLCERETRVQEWPTRTGADFQLGFTNRLQLVEEREIQSGHGARRLDVPGGRHGRPTGIRNHAHEVRGRMRRLVDRLMADRSIMIRVPQAVRGRPVRKGADRPACA